LRIAHSLRLCGGDLDQGEAEAIALALELHADLLLIDEREGRPHCGTAWIARDRCCWSLNEAKTQAKLSQVKPMLDRLRHDAGFYISERVYTLARVSREAKS
jgi:predicted nucleic acid-binding protein